MWSPDGTRIAFLSGRDGRYEIYLMKADGSEQTRLTSGPGNNISPCWSPDGQRIAFSSDRDGHYEIFVIKADGSEQVQLTDAPGENTAPAWLR